MSCKGCKKKTKKHNPSNLITGIKDNNSLKFISSKKGKVTTFIILLILWPIIAILLPIAFYWAIFGFTKNRTEIEDEQPQNTNTTERAGQLSEYQT